MRELLSLLLSLIKVVCYEKRDQSEGGDRGGPKETMRTQQGS